VSFARAVERAVAGLDTWEVAYLGLVLGVCLQQWMTSDGPTRVTEQDVTLAEDDLRRLEDGDSLAVHRWHGHELHLRGDVVVDVPSEVETDQGDGEESD